MSDVEERAHSWNYRLVEIIESDEDDDDYTRFEICEVHYDDEGDPHGYIPKKHFELPVEDIGDITHDADDARESFGWKLDKIRACLDKPRLVADPNTGEFEETEPYEDWHD